VILCQQCQAILHGEAPPRAVASVPAWWYRCAPCGISYVVPVDHGPAPPVIITAREHLPDVLLVGWVGFRLWC